MSIMEVGGWELDEHYDHSPAASCLSGSRGKGPPGGKEHGALTPGFFLTEELSERGASVFKKKTKGKKGQVH